MVACVTAAPSGMFRPALMSISRCLSWRVICEGPFPKVSAARPLSGTVASWKPVDGTDDRMAEPVLVDTEPLLEAN